MIQKKPLGHGMAYFLLALTVLFWSGNWVVGRGIRGDVPPLALSFWRWFIAFVCLLPWAWPHIRSQWREMAKHWRILTLLGLFGGACNNALTYLGVTYTTVANCAILAASTPIMIVGLSWALFGKRLRAVEWLGVALSVCGILAIVGNGDIDTLLALQVNTGDIWVLAAMLFWALYTVLLVRRPAGLHPLSFLAAISAIGLAALLPLYLWEIAGGQVINPSPAAMAAIAYAGIFPALLGFIFWNMAVLEVGSNKAGFFMNLMPVFSIILSILFLGEQPHPYHLAGIALILSGIYLTSTRR
jgi:drug/metabolite transporter (DMT)-like permease